MKDFIILSISPIKHSNITTLVLTITTTAQHGHYMRQNSLYVTMV